MPKNTTQEVSTSANRTRRNMFKIGALAGTVFMASALKSKQAMAIPTTCFMRGTMIRTADGERRVEDLAAGDLLPALFGGTGRIQWISRFSYRKSEPSQPWAKDQLPVRIARSALGPNIPHADLFVTPAHAICIDGVLVQAGMLVNGTTITLHDAHECDTLEFFHIKLENHNVIYAEGAPCETLGDEVTAADEHREEPRINEGRCLPLLTFSGGRSELKSRLRSALSPWIDRREKIDVLRDYLEEHGVFNARPFSTAETRTD